MSARWHTKKSLEALDRMLQDLRKNKNWFGGAMILLAGDFRQTLVVVPRSTPANELNACLKSSTLWKDIKMLKLNMKMPVELQQRPIWRSFFQTIAQYW